MVEDESFNLQFPKLLICLSFMAEGRNHVCLVRVVLLGLHLLKGELYAMAGLLRRCRQLSLDLQADSEDEGRRTKKMKASSSADRALDPDGPLCVEDCLGWQNDVARRILQLWRLRHVSTEVKKIVVHLTSSYSGVGFAEAGLQLMARALRHHTLFEVAVTSYSQSELNQDCQTALTGEHVFQDLLSRVSHEVLQELTRMQEEKLMKLKNSSTPKCPVLKKDLSDEFFQEAVAFLDSTPDEAWKPQAFCKTCKKQCAWAPSLPNTDPSVLHIWAEVAGNTCTPWSARGSKLGWLDKVSLAALIWGWSLKRLATPPDLIVNECTPLWPGEIFFEALFKTALIESAKFSPVDLGTWKRLCLLKFFLGTVFENLCFRHFLFVSVWPNDLLLRYSRQQTQEVHPGYNP